MMTIVSQCPRFRLAASSACLAASTTSARETVSGLAGLVCAAASVQTTSISVIAARFIVCL